MVRPFNGLNQYSALTLFPILPVSYLQYLLSLELIPITLPPVKGEELLHFHYAVDRPFYRIYLYSALILYISTQPFSYLEYILPLELIPNALLPALGGVPSMVVT